MLMTPPVRQRDRARHQVGEQTHRQSDSGGRRLYVGDIPVTQPDALGIVRMQIEIVGAPVGGDATALEAHEDEAPVVFDPEVEPDRDASG